MVIYVVAMAVALMATEGKPGRGWILLALGALFAVLFVWFAVKASRFPCPRCGQQFNINCWIAWACRRAGARTVASRSERTVESSVVRENRNLGRAPASKPVPSEFLLRISGERE